MALPDIDSAWPLADRLRDHDSREIHHPSGRPWLLGSWPAEDMTVHAGATRVAVLGEHAVTTDQLLRLARRARHPADLDSFVRGLHGSAHILACIDGVQRIQGPVLPTRRVFLARINGVATVADRADLLAWLAGTGIDDQRLAAHLVAPIAPYPLGGRPVWTGVEEVPSGHYLTVDRVGDTRMIRWWEPPHAELPMAEGARMLREELTAAVSVRLPDRGAVTCDLAGLDSTSLCALAAGMADKTFALTVASTDTADDDLRWARHTAAELGTFTHEVIAADRMPLRYHGWREADERFDEPCVFAADRARVLTLFRWAAEHESRRHFAGFGGDELLTGSASWLSSYLRTDPRTAWRNFRGYQARAGLPRLRALRQLLDPRRYRSYLARAADHLTEPRADDDAYTFGWGFGAQLGPWVTEDAVRAARTAMHAAARAACPLSPTIGLHEDLEMMLGGARVARQFQQIAGRAGAPLSVPYYDDRVIGVGLAVRPQDRVTPWRYKPLIAHAMEGLVPHETLHRNTKAHGAASEAQGLAEHGAELMELFEDSVLARRGLIDRATVLAHLDHPPADPNWFFSVIYPAIGCEIWLRTVS